MSFIPRAAPLAPFTVALLWGCAPKVPPDSALDSTETGETGDSATPLAPRLLVSGYKSAAVLVLDPADGAVVTSLPGLPGAQATRVHPDGRLLLVAEEVPGVFTADAKTFEGLTALIQDDPNTEADETGGLTSPTGVAFLANGELVVGDYKTDRILRYDAQGATLGVFAEGVDGLDGPDAGLVVGPEGDLWVPCFESNLILRLDAAGAVVERIEGATNPRHLWFDAEGALWVSSWGSGEILRREGGAFTVVVSPRAPTGFVVEPDGAAIWVTSDQTSRVLRIDIATGEVLTTLNPGDTGLEGGTFLTWR
ncbi:hypothetical protein L6R49_23225 [Myxococcota bacterium]|nr:hypothetical protein [Myxococcota bacterium]